MADIRKTIERLKELEARATPGLWESDGITCAVRVDRKPIGIIPYYGARTATECDQTDRDMHLITAMRNALPELLQKLQDLLPANNEKLVTEWCSVCGAEASMHWDIKDAGYKAYCPHCGAHLMLCSECIDEHGPCGAGKDGDSECDDRDYARDKSDYSGGE